MTWTILTLMWYSPTDFQLVGEYPTQQACIRDIRQYQKSNELPKELGIQQCVQVDKDAFHEYVNSLEEEANRIRGGQL